MNRAFPFDEENSIGEIIRTFKSRYSSFFFTRLANVAGYDRIGIPVHAVFRPDSYSSTIAMGKGLSEGASIISAVMESFEIWIAEQLTTDLSIDVFLENSNNLLNRNLECFFDQPERIKTRLKADVVPGNRYFSAQQCVLEYVPMDCICMRPLASDLQSAIPLVSTNGLASGVTRDSAILHGLCEVVERDAVTIFHSQNLRSQTSRLVSNDFLKAFVPELVKKVESAGLSVRVFDITTDVKIPCYLAILIDKDRSTPIHLRLVSGSACRVQAKRAVIAAIVEAAQARVAIIMAAREDFSYFKKKEINRILGEEHLATVFTKVLLESTGTLQISNNYDCSSASEQIEFVMEALVKLDYEDSPDIGKPIVIDLLNDVIGRLHVVKVFIIGLELPHDDTHYKEGVRASSYRY